MTEKIASDHYDADYFDWQRKIGIFTVKQTHLSLIDQ